MSFATNLEEYHHERKRPEHCQLHHLLRMLQAAGQEAPEVKPILEINPEHALIAKVQAADDEAFGEWAQLLLEQAMLAEGGHAVKWKGSPDECA